LRDSQLTFLFQNNISNEVDNEDVLNKEEIITTTDNHEPENKNENCLEVSSSADDFEENNKIEPVIETTENKEEEKIIENSPEQEESLAEKSKDSESTKQEENEHKDSIPEINKPEQLLQASEILEESKLFEESNETEKSSNELEDPKLEESKEEEPFNPNELNIPQSEIRVKSSDTYDIDYDGTEEKNFGDQVIVEEILQDPHVDILIIDQNEINEENEEELLSDKEIKSVQKEYEDEEFDDNDDVVVSPQRNLSADKPKLTGDSTKEVSLS
jgi:hypothetical protein